MLRPFTTALFILLTIPATAAAQACPDAPQLSRAQFATAIRDRQPVTAPDRVPAEAPAVYFFTRITGGNGATITHVWHYGDEEVVRVPLRIGGNDWRTWSSKNLGLRRQRDWRVRVETADGCLLGEHVLPAVPPNGTIMERVRALLQEGDLAGARLETKRALAADPDPRLRQALETFLARDLELARAAREIDQEALYTARSRLAALLQEPLKDSYREQVLALRDKLLQRSETLRREATAQLDDLGRALSATLAGGRLCDTLAGEADTLLDQWLGETRPFIVTGQNPEGSGLTLALLDRRSGDSHEITINCLRFAYPDPPPSGD